MPTNFANVKAFHEKFDLLRPDLPTLLPADVLEFRVKFMHEEINEFTEAHAAGDLATAADSLIDAVYVVMGTAVMMGLPWQLLWDAVQQANMQKVRAIDAYHSASTTGRGHAQDVVKPVGWKHPDIKQLLIDYVSWAMNGGVSAESLTRDATAE